MHFKSAMSSRFNRKTKWNVILMEKQGVNILSVFLIISRKLSWMEYIPRLDDFREIEKRLKYA